MPRHTHPPGLQMTCLRLCPALIIMLLLSAHPEAARAQELADAVQHFDEGNRLYKQGSYSAALDAYRRAEAGAYVSGALYYNMGNAYYRMDEIGQAIRYYEKARSVMPDHPKVLHNLEMARDRTVDTFSQLPDPFWRPWWRRFILLAGVERLFFAGLAFYFAAAALAGYRIWTEVQSPWHRRGQALAVTAGVLLLALSFTASVEQQIDRRGVVTAQQATLYEAPDPGEASRVSVHEGLLIEILTEHGTWVEVRLPNGATGWIDRQTVAEI